MKKVSKCLSLGLGLVAATAMLASCGGTKEEFNNEASIKLYTRDTTSGTRDGFFTGINFKEVATKNDALAEGVVTVEGNGDMINSIKNDEYGIGYVSLASVQANKELKGLVYEGVAPTEENVLNGTYKLTRNFNYCTRTIGDYQSEDEEQIVQAFIAYMSTKEGKATIISKDGIVETSSSDKSWNDIKGDYPVAIKDNSSLTISVGGSTSVEKIVKALLEEFSPKCGNFKYIQNHTGSGDAQKRTQGSEKDGANALDLAFASREFKDTETLQEGTNGKMCIDAIVAVVNALNDLSEITAEKLKGMYDGTYTKWSEIK